MMHLEIEIQSQQVEQSSPLLKKEQEKKEVILTKLKDLRQKFCQNRNVISKMSAAV